MSQATVSRDYGELMPPLREYAPQSHVGALSARYAAAVREAEVARQDIVLFEGQLADARVRAQDAEVKVAELFRRLQDHHSAVADGAPFVVIPAA
jgi:hypothetical protein